MEGVKEVSLKYLNVKNVTDTTADIYFYGEISGDEWDKWTEADKCPEDVIKALKKAEGKDINIYINSPGGSVFAGIAIYNMIKRSKGRKTVHIDGLAASIASVIAMCGDEIIMPSNAFLMIHKPWSVCMGNAEEMRNTAESLDTIERGITEIYRENLIDEGKIEKIKALMAEETWLTAEKAREYFKNITVAEPNRAVAKAEWLKGFKNIPEGLKREENTENKEKEVLMLQSELLFL